MNLIANNTIAQATLNKGYLDLIIDFSEESLIMSTKINIDAMSYSDYLIMLTKIKESDQKYRIKLKQIDEKKDSIAFWKTISIMEKNDRANQIVLLKLLKKFDWPCSKDINMSFYAWLVVWHSDIFYRQDFYPFMKKALKKGCILKAHYEEFRIE